MILRLETGNDSLRFAIAKAREIARRMKIEVAFDYNGAELRVHWDDEESDVLDRYIKELESRHAR